MSARPPPPPGPEALTARGNFFEDFRVGQRMEHARGRTIEEAEHVLFTSRVLNTAQIHFNRVLAESDPDLQRQFEGRQVVVGAYVLALAMGLASEDTTENALAILGVPEARHTAGVRAGETLFARSEVLATRPAEQEDAGIVRFRLTGLTGAERRPVLEATYDALLRRRPRGAAASGAAR
jgi:itaconyl-CoA hydratase